MKKDEVLKTKQHTHHTAAQRTDTMRLAYNAFRLFVYSFNDDLMYVSEEEKN